VKDHVNAVKECARRAAEVQARLAKIDAEHTKHALAYEGAVHQADELRTRARHIAALAAIGEASETDVQKAEADASSAEARAAKIAATVKGLDDERAACHATLAALPDEHKAAMRAVLRTAWDPAKYVAAAQALAIEYRRAAAFERLLSKYGDSNYRLLRDMGECHIPAPIGYEGKTVGPYGELLFDGRTATLYTNPTFTAAYEDVVDELANLGLEL
jgi:hypothetical protein